jgi:Rps23 Pro-64 3,4-dihydroxylase Tpa1-like proline 4-hydroxylase
MITDKLLLYGQKLLLENPDIKVKRRIISTNTCLSEIDDILKLVKGYVENFDSYKIVTLFKQKTKGDIMKPHVDDHQKVNLKKLIKNPEKYIHMHGDTYLFCNDMTPVFSIIYYCTTHKQDFCGGKLVFADGVEITPESGMIVIFDSREVHSVTSITSGIRKNWLIKLYPIPGPDNMMHVIDNTVLSGSNVP